MLSGRAFHRRGGPARRIYATYHNTPPEVYSGPGRGLPPAAKRTHPRTAHDARHTAFLMSKKLVWDLVPRVMDSAEYWSRQDTTFDIGRIVFQAGEGMAVLATPPLSAQQAGHVRRVTFTITSHDQGWGGEPADQGTLNGGWTWFEAHVRRRNAAPHVYRDSVGDFHRKREGAPRDSGADPWTAYGGRRLISNYTATGTPTTQTVVWRYDADGELDCGGDEDYASWQRDTLKSMREGDRIVLTAHAFFPGWVNYVESASVAIDTACLH